MRKLKTLLCASALIVFTLNTGVAAEGIPGNSDFGGWNILQPGFDTGVPQLDGLALEWEYFMIHDKQDGFTGVIGYVLSDPNGYMEGLAPSGGNVIIAGQIGDERFADYQSFGIDGTIVSASERTFSAENSSTGTYANLTPRGKALLLEGQGETYAWDLVVSQDWINNDKLITSPDSAFTPKTTTDIGGIGEIWTVDAIWPRTRVEGTITNLSTGEIIQINGHGYRENSWGRWAFIYGGWDFAVLSDKHSKVQFALQTYYSLPRPDGSVNTPSTGLDFIDISFEDKTGSQTERVSRRFTGLQLGHTIWEFDYESWQCRPLNTQVAAEDDLYVVEAAWDIGDHQVPVLSDATPIIQTYVIQEHFPIITGTIHRKVDGDNILVKNFSGQAGGEFSSPRSQEPIPTDPVSCATFGYLTTIY